MPYTPDPLDDTQPQVGTVPAMYAAPEFRAIKTLLKTHNTSISSNATAIANANTRVDNISKKTAQLLTGAGNFTVPAGVTTLWVTVTAGGLAGFTVLENGSGSYCYMRPQAAIPVTSKLTVAPGDIIAYNAGANEVLGTSQTGSGPILHTISKTTSAADATFGSITAQKPVDQRVREINSWSAGARVSPSYGLIEWTFTGKWNLVSNDSGTPSTPYPQKFAETNTPGFSKTLLPAQGATILVEY